MLEKLRERLAEWVAVVADELGRAEPDLPVVDRAALVSIADAAAGTGPETARTACQVLIAAADAADEDQSLGVRLLADVRAIFAAKSFRFCRPRWSAELRRVEETRGGVRVDGSKLAYRLREFGIRPGRNAAGSARGWRLEDFTTRLRGTPARTQRRQIRRLAMVSILTALTNDPSEGISRLTGSDGLKNDPSDALPLFTCDSDGPTLSDGVGAENAPRGPASPPPSGPTAAPNAAGTSHARPPHRLLRANEGRPRDNPPPAATLSLTLNPPALGPPSARPSSITPAADRRPW